MAISRKVSHNKMSPDLLTLLEQRLEAEGIDLTEEPYSDKVSQRSSIRREKHARVGHQNVNRVTIYINLIKQYEKNKTFSK